MNTNLLQAETLTHHCVDDMSPQDEAMQTFFTYSSFSVLNTSISLDGKILRVRIRDEAMSKEYQRRARLAIIVFQLPLKAELIAGFLVVTYTGR